MYMTVPKALFGLIFSVMPQRGSCPLEGLRCTASVATLIRR